MHMCINYKELNKVMVKNKYQLLRIDYKFDQLKNVSIFFKIDLRSRYYHVWVPERDILKTIYQTRNKYYEFIMMPFGLINTPTIFID